MATFNDFAISHCYLPHRHLLLWIWIHFTSPLLRWLEAKQAYFKHGEALSRLAESVQQKLDNAVMSNDKTEILDAYCNELPAQEPQPRLKTMLSYSRRRRAIDRFSGDTDSIACRATCDLCVYNRTNFYAWGSNIPWIPPPSWKELQRPHQVLNYEGAKVFDYFFS